MKTITIKDVAIRAGVSPKTVSRVINGEQHVRPEIRDIVLRVVAELDYRPNPFARSLSSSRSYLLGLFLDDPASGYANDVQFGALMRSRAQSYHLVVEPVNLASPHWIAEVEQSIRALRLEGVILTPPICDNAALLDMLDAAGIAYVRIAPSADFHRSGLVEMDDFAAASDMTRHLIALGHRTIAFIKGDPNHSASRKRYDGFCATMAEGGLAVDQAYVLEGDFSFRSALGPATALLTADVRPTAVFASNDDMALGVLVTAMKLDVAVPEMLSIAGFDDAPTARAAWPPLTTIRQPKSEMAAAAIDILVDPGYRGAATDQRYRRLLPYELISRDSTAKI
ncbi:LacI family DNA-binding transcriptional regulator [Sphingomonas sp.]|uniref:LacI family DNA-binding transcriptional regulator n=1 Tax=Sphingomonas sp. TaxID=28214 RepID=UPI0025DE3F03|nr:LacI family DNA-binding transcriptional regulator [Sphingomonas sp.]